MFDNLKSLLSKNISEISDEEVLVFFANKRILNPLLLKNQKERDVISKFYNSNNLKFVNTVTELKELLKANAQDLTDNWMINASDFQYLRSHNEKLMLLIKNNLFNLKDQHNIISIYVKILTNKEKKDNHVVKQLENWIVRNKIDLSLLKNEERYKDYIFNNIQICQFLTENGARISVKNLLGLETEAELALPVIYFIKSKINWEENIVWEKEKENKFLISNQNDDKPERVESSALMYALCNGYHISIIKKIYPLCNSLYSDSKSFIMNQVRYSRWDFNTNCLYMGVREVGKEIYPNYNVGMDCLRIYAKQDMSAKMFPSKLGKKILKSQQEKIETILSDPRFKYTGLVRENNEDKDIMSFVIESGSWFLARKLLVKYSKEFIKQLNEGLVKKDLLSILKHKKDKKDDLILKNRVFSLLLKHNVKDYNTETESGVKLLSTGNSDIMWRILFKRKEYDQQALIKQVLLSVLSEEKVENDVLINFSNLINMLSKNNTPYSLKEIWVNALIEKPVNIGNVQSKVHEKINAFIHIAQNNDCHLIKDKPKKRL